MNYIKLINWFWDEAIYYDDYKAEYGILFLAVIDSINNNQWNEVEINYDRIINKTKLSKRAYLEARNWLQENKLIDFIAGKNEYSRAKFSIGIAVQNCTSTVPLPSLYDTSTAPLLPHNSTATSTSTAPSIINNETLETLETLETSKHETDNDSLFEKFWELYDKKVDKATTQKRWSKLKEATKQEILLHVPKYVAATPDSKYRKNPATYLSKRAWEDEIILPAVSLPLPLPLHPKQTPIPSNYQQPYIYYYDCLKLGLRPLRWDDDKILSDTELDEILKFYKLENYAK
jgi:hypothetical protein